MSPNSPTEQARRELAKVLAESTSCCAHDFVVDAVWDWHLRHSNQPEKIGDIASELGKSARKQIDAVGELGKLFDTYEGAPTVSALMDWHNAHAPQPPTREAVVILFERWHIGNSRAVKGNPYAPFEWQEGMPEKFYDELLVLFSQGSGPREWCVSHIRESHGKIELLDKDYFRVTPVTDEWQCCPICGAARPRPEGGDGE